VLSCLTGDKELVIDAAKTAFICHTQHADDDADVSLGNGRHDNRHTANAMRTTSSNHSLIDSCDVPLTDRV